MLRIHSIDVSGFKGIQGNVHLDLGKSALTGVVGANGLGKSCIVEAVQWCLQGQRAQTSQINMLMDAASCRVSFSKGAKQISVGRSLRRLSKGIESRYSLNGAKSTRSEVQEALQSMAGNDADALIRRSIVSQNEVASGKSMLGDPAGLADIIERACLGTELRDRSAEMGIFIASIDELEMLSDDYVASSSKQADELSSEMREHLHGVARCSRCLQRRIEVAEVQSAQCAEKAEESLVLLEEHRASLKVLSSQHDEQEAANLGCRLQTDSKAKALREAKAKHQRAMDHREQQAATLASGEFEIKRLMTAQSRASKSAERAVQQTSDLTSAKSELSSGLQLLQQEESVAAEKVACIERLLQTQGIHDADLPGLVRATEVLQRAIESTESAVGAAVEFGKPRALGDDAAGAEGHKRDAKAISAMVAELEPRIEAITTYWSEVATLEHPTTRGIHIPVSLQTQVKLAVRSLSRFALDVPASIRTIQSESETVEELKVQLPALERTLQQTEHTAEVSAAEREAIIPSVDRANAASKQANERSVAATRELTDCKRRLAGMPCLEGSDKPGAVRLPRWYQQNLAFVGSGNAPGVLGLLSEQPVTLINPNAALAINTVIGTRASRCILAEDRKAATTILRRAQAAKAGPFECIVVSDYRKSAAGRTQSSVDQHATDSSRQSIPLISAIRGENEAMQLVLGKMLGGWMLCNTLAVATSLRRSQGVSCVTLQGELVRASGELVGGKAASIAVPLVREQAKVLSKSELTQLRQVRDRLLEHLPELERVATECDAASEHAKQALQEAVTQESTIIDKESECAMQAEQTRQQVASCKRAIARGESNVRRFRLRAEEARQQVHAATKELQLMLRPLVETVTEVLSMVGSQREVEQAKVTPEILQHIKRLSRQQQALAQAKARLLSKETLAKEIDTQLAAAASRAHHAQSRADDIAAKLEAAQTSRGRKEQVVRDALELVEASRLAVETASAHLDQARQMQAKGSSRLGGIKKNRDKKQAAVEDAETLLHKIRASATELWNKEASFLREIIPILSSSGIIDCPSTVLRALGDKLGKRAYKVDKSVSPAVEATLRACENPEDAIYPDKREEVKLVLQYSVSMCSLVDKAVGKAGGVLLGQAIRSSEALTRGALDSDSDSNDENDEDEDEDEDQDEDESSSEAGGVSTARSRRARMLRGVRARRVAGDISDDGDGSEHETGLFSEAPNTVDLSSATMDDARVQELIAASISSSELLQLSMRSPLPMPQPELLAANCRLQSMLALLDARIQSSFGRNGRVPDADELERLLEAAGVGGGAASDGGERHPHYLFASIARLQTILQLSLLQDKVLARRRDVFGRRSQCDLERQHRMMAVMRAVSDSLRSIFRTMTAGTGDAVLRYSSSIKDLLGGSLRIEARPDEAGWRQVRMLSGGQQAIVTIALFLGIHAAAPTPFLILDEIDAALDTVKVGRLAELLRDTALKSKTSILVVSHRQELWEKCTSLFGLYATPEGLRTVIRDFEPDDAVDADNGDASGNAEFEAKAVVAAGGTPTAVTDRLAPHVSDGRSEHRPATETKAATATDLGLGNKHRRAKLWRIDGGSDDGFGDASESDSDCEGGSGHGSDMDSNDMNAEGCIPETPVSTSGTKAGSCISRKPEAGHPSGRKKRAVSKESQSGEASQSGSPSPVESLKTSKGCEAPTVAESRGGQFSGTSRVAIQSESESESESDWSDSGDE